VLHENFARLWNFKRKALGESSVGKWHDRMYCVVAVRFQPKLDSKGKPLRYRLSEK
jgi:hypothetical protein